MFSPKLLDHFEHPRNTGAVADANAVAEVENPACGDVLQLTARVVDGRIEELRFRAQGCVASMGCASALTVLAAGKTLAEASRVRREDVVAEVGGLPPESLHASHLTMDALAALMAKIHP